MKILAIMGSPRKRGNAALLLEKAIEGASQAGAEIIRLDAADLKLAPCLACGGCDRTGKCVVNDGITAVAPLIEQVDGIIVSTPIFFMGIPAQLKILIDRCQPFWAKKYLLKKPIYVPVVTSQDDETQSKGKMRKGLLIAVGGTNFPQTFDAIKLVIKTFFHCIDVEYSNEVLIPGVDAHGAISEYPEALSKVYNAGEELVRAIQSSESNTGG